MSAVAGKAAGLMIQIKIAKDGIPVCSVLNTAAMGSGVGKTVGMAEPSKEETIRRKAKKGQRKLDR
jgi:hypothetical protein